MFFDHGLLIDLIFCLFGTPFQQFSSYFHVCGLIYLTRIFSMSIRICVLCILTSAKASYHWLTKMRNVTPKKPLITYSFQGGFPPSKTECWSAKSCTGKHCCCVFMDATDMSCLKNSFSQNSFSFHGSYILPAFSKNAPWTVKGIMQTSCAELIT